MGIVDMERVALEPKVRARVGRTDRGSEELASVRIASSVWMEKLWHDLALSHNGVKRRGVLGHCQADSRQKQKSRPSSKQSSELAISQQ